MPRILQQARLRVPVGRCEASTRASTFYHTAQNACYAHTVGANGSGNAAFRCDEPGFVGGGTARAGWEQCRCDIREVVLKRAT